MEPEKPIKETRGGAREGAGRKTQVTRIDVWEEMCRRNFDPLQELINLATAPNTETKLRVQILLETLQYVAAKQKAITHEFDNSDNNVLGQLFVAIKDQGRPQPPSAARNRIDRKSSKLTVKKPPADDEEK